MRRSDVVFAALVLLAAPAFAQPTPAPAAPQTKTSPGAGPIIVIETSRGIVEFETYPEDAPKTVNHIVALVQRRFYNGQRVHRVEPNFLIQMGDPQTRDYTKRDMWGRGPGAGSGKPIGAAELSKRRTNVRGAVGMAHAGDPTQADSQFYILRKDSPGLNGKYVIFGKVITGMDVVDKIQVGDVIKRMTVKNPTT
jgi:cyclophilin family peptidyl-prolyl cis-trans isomerase